MKTRIATLGVALLALAGPVPIDVTDCCASRPGKPADVVAQATQAVDDAWEW
ncbi:hypothetical protein ACIA8G_39795 [Lentzea sp. NPDC051213]|uniref:hypothetical protein n=1 Tax=Lentzea sp. NPDC051213 TaxID=3364126 RepID=UPI0037BC8150